MTMTDKTAAALKTLSAEQRRMSAASQEAQNREHKAQWCAGWAAWCRFESDEDDRTLAWRAGYHHAADVNENGGGSRPRISEASDTYFDTHILNNEGRPVKV